MAVSLFRSTLLSRSVRVPLSQCLISVSAAELPTPLPPFPGFVVTNTRADWVFNFARFPKLYDLTAAIDHKTLKIPQASRAASSPIKPKVRVVTQKNWKEA